MNNKTLYQFLAYLGAVPFVLCAVLPIFAIHELPFLGTTKHIAAIYGLTIVSFMAGIHWGTYLYKQSASPSNLFFISNIITLICWFAYLLVNEIIYFIVLILAFAFLLITDYQLSKASLISDDYLRMRRNVTSIVIASLTLILILN